MKAIVKERPEEGGLTFRDLPVPEPGAGEVLLKNRAVAICGTDLHIYNWDAWSQKRVRLPIILGHEFAADVVKVGSGVRHVRIGDYVSGEGHLVCGFCDNCRTGNGHVCYDWKGLGYDVDGVFREYFVMPEANIWVNDPDTPEILAAIQDPLGNAVHTVFKVDCVGKRVAVYGLGPVGLLAVGILKGIGAAEIFAFGRSNAYRLDLARKMGAHHVQGSRALNPVEYIKQHTRGNGVDVAMEIAGTSEAILSAIQSVKMGGDVILLGIPNRDVSIDIAADIVFRSVSIHGITGRRIWDSWFRMKGLLNSGNLNIEHVITHQFLFNEFEQGFRLMQKGNCGKVVLTL
jgi:threonine 3-dehydrogenase